MDATREATEGVARSTESALRGIEDKHQGFGDDVTRMMKAGLAGLVFLGLVSCADNTPTSVDPSLLTAKAATVELRLPWSQFGSDFGVYGGYGYPYQLGTGVVANTSGGLQAKTLADFSGFATNALVRDSVGTILTDTAAVVAGATVTLVFDTLTSSVPGDLTLQLGAVQEPWDAVSVTWDMAIDTVNNRVAWSQPGGGQIVPLATATWNPDLADTIVFTVDSATVASLADTTLLTNGIVISSLNQGTRLRITSLSGQLKAKSKISPDTTLYLTSALAHMTFMYSPSPPAPTGEMRVGGVPAWRTTMRITAPERLDSLPALCAVVSCPMTLRADQVDYAALVLHTDTSYAAFQPADTVGIDVRQVLSPTNLPKSPLGTSLVPNGYRLPPFDFNRPGGQDIEVPITSFVQNMLASDTTSAGLPLSHVLALLSTSEPLSIAYATFQGPGQAYPPVLRLIVTASKPVVLP